MLSPASLVAFLFEIVFGGERLAPSEGLSRSFVILGIVFDSSFGALPIVDPFVDAPFRAKVRMRLGHFCWLLPIPSAYGWGQWKYALVNSSTRWGPLAQGENNCRSSGHTFVFASALLYSP